MISQAAGGSIIEAMVYGDAVQFTVQNDQVEIMRAEVFNLKGDTGYTIQDLTLVT